MTEKFLSDLIKIRNYALYKLTSWSHEEVTPVGTTLEDLKGELALIMQCLDKEVIDIGGGEE